jgi:hypothetical protein
MNINELIDQLVVIQNEHGNDTHILYENGDDWIHVYHIEYREFETFGNEQVKMVILG